MPNPEPFTALAEAVADGQPVDWASLELSTSDGAEREAVGALHHLAVVGELFASLARSSGGFGTPIARLEPGAEWAGLRIVAYLGSGRFGDVYRAWDPALERHIALKLVGCDPGPDAGTPVVDEGRLMARVRHPNVVTIYGAQRIGNSAGLSMELIEGRTLEDELAGTGPYGADQLEQTGVDLSRALAAVHEAGLLHRDVKASNVLRDPSGRVVLGDFGTSWEVQLEADAARGLVGTPAYLAPELFAGEPATPRSDVYSLGVLLFHLATGEYPVAAKTLGDLRDAHTVQTPRSLRTERPDLPPALTAIVDRALARDPEQRFASGRDMASAFEGLRAPTAPWWRSPSAAVAAALMTVVGLFIWQSRPAPFEFRERDWVLVGAFDNRTNNPLLDGAVEEALELELGDSPVVNVVPPVRVEDTLALMRQPFDAVLDERLAREVALRDGGIRAILAGQIDLIGETYRLVTRIRNPADGALVATLTDTAPSEADVLPAVRRLAAGVRARLGEELPALATAPNADLSRVTTQSLRAWDLYRRALPALYPDSNPGVAEQLLSEAIREDPEFAVAHVALARAIFAQGMTSGERTSQFRSADIERHLEAARALSDRVSLEDRYRIAAESARLRQVRTRGEQAKAHRLEALAALEALHQLRPDDTWVIQSLLQTEGSDSPRRVPLAEQLVSLRPNSLSALSLATTVAVESGADDLARSYLARARPLLDLPIAERAGNGPAVTVRIHLFMDAWNQDDIEQAVALAGELDALDGRSDQAASTFYADGGMSSVFIALGQLKRGEDIASHGQRYGVRLLRIAAGIWSRQDPEHARRFLDQHDIDADSPVAQSFVPLFVLAGRLDDARATLAQMRSLGVPEPFLDTAEAQLALGEGHPERAIELVTPLVAEDANVVRSNLLAAAWEAAGNTNEAIRALERAARPRTLARPGVFATHHWYEQQDRLARLYREVGRTAEADQIDQRLGVLLTFADSDHPIKLRLSAIEGR